MKFVGERRALAAIVLAFWFLLYLMQALLGGGPLAPVMYALAGTYGLAFFALVAGYFWARWYAVGINLFGLIIGGISLWQIGPEFQVMLIVITHLVATVMLWGSAMSELYDGQTAWRERYHMDDGAVQRLGRSVIRAGVSLPMVLIYGLMPKQGAALVASVAVIVVATLGLRALVRLRTWGVLALGGAGAVMLAIAGIEGASHAASYALSPALAGSLLVFAAAPWFAPVARWLRA
jgi:hypothetical protein